VNDIAYFVTEMIYKISVLENRVSDEQFALRLIERMALTPNPSPTSAEASDALRGARGD
jgi:hypothetical protein